MQATISMLQRKVEPIIERISVHASFVTIYAHQAYILYCSLCFCSSGILITNFGRLGASFCLCWQKYFTIGILLQSQDSSDLHISIFFLVA